MYLRTFEGTFETLRRYLIYLLIQVLLLFVTNKYHYSNKRIHIFTLFISIYPYFFRTVCIYTSLYMHVINLTYIILFITYEGTFEGIYVHNIPECLIVKNVRFTWYRLSNITVYSFHTLISILFYFIFKSKILV